MNTVLLRIGKPNSNSLSLNQYLHNGGVGAWKYDKNKIINFTKLKICNWNQTKMIIADIVDFTETLDPITFNKKYYIKFNNAIIINQCDISFNGQCARKYI